MDTGELRNGNRLGAPSQPSRARRFATATALAIPSTVMASPLLISGQPITLADLNEVALAGRAVALDPAALPRIRASRSVVDALLARGGTAYGINTGFGKLSDVRIEPG